MILLCDLDGTLLANRMSDFQPIYLKALGKHLSSRVPPDKMINELMHGTSLMLQNDNPLITLESSFDQYFYPHLGVEKQAIIDLILEFYETTFPSLGTLTNQIPDAISFVEDQISIGSRVVIATNPLFPRIATFNRLVWAGLPVTQNKFELVTTYEFMHFTKPRPEYYAEILAYLGYPNEPVVMIGNDLEEDVLASQQLSIPAFWLTITEPIKGNSSEYPHAGTFIQLHNFIKSIEDKPQIYDDLSMTAFTAIMKATLAALHSYIKYSCAIHSKDTHFAFENLLSNRESKEFISISKLFEINQFNTIKDKLSTTSEIFPTDFLSGFSQNRLLWLSLLDQIDFQSLHKRDISILSSFILDCISDDRQLMLSISACNKECPKFISQN